MSSSHSLLTRFTTAFAGAALLVLLARSLAKRWRSKSGGLPYPPGPPGNVVLGNIRDMPSVKPWLTFARWSKQYESGVVHVNVLGQHIVVVNSAKDANELFEKRSHLYSDRPSLPMVELMGWGYNSALLRYGDKWRRHRRMFQQVLKKDSAVVYHPIQTKKVREMLRELLTTPEDFARHYRTASAAVIMATVYGHDVAPKNDYFVGLAEEAVTKASENLLPGATLVNVFPILRFLPSWFPGVKFRRLAADCRKLTDDMQNVPFEFVKKNMIEGTQKQSILSDLLDANGHHGDFKDGEDDIKAVATTTYAAGSDTTVSTVGTFFLAMTLHPEVQRKAQEELDSVVGTGRLPDISDRPYLPYLEAVYREVMRWRPALPLGLPHATTEDDIYNGYFIPKGSYVMSNIWAMAHDESVYSHPEKFLPERFLDPKGKLNNDEMNLVFGFGRRFCVGRHMASSTVWLTMASVLAAFNITRAKDAQGIPISVSDEYTDGAVSHPQPFQCSVQPRSNEVKAIIEASQS